MLYSKNRSLALINLHMLTYYAQKKIIDLLFSFCILITFSPFILIAFIIVSFETKSFGFYAQKRVGLNGRIFTLYKLKTMYDTKESSTCTASNDKRISKFGKILRRFKIDEIPQMFNVLKGEMSLVGPRPDVPSFTNTLIGDQIRILSVKPGITGPASLIFRHEELILSRVPDPESYSLNILWPQKVNINLIYIKKKSIYHDLKLIMKTIFSPLFPTLLVEYAKFNEHCLLNL